MEHEVNPTCDMNCISTNTNLCYSKRRGLQTSTCTNSGCYTCKKLDGVGAWLCQGVAAFYFASLDWFSCMYVQTTDSLEDGSMALPMITKSHVEMSEACTEISKQA